MKRKNARPVGVKKSPTGVDEYISQAPEAVQGKLKELRKILKETVPQAEEKLSYSMPYYGYKGRLAYFAYAKKHIGLYLMPPLTEVYKKDLEGYVTSKSAIQFPLNQELPIPLIKKLITAGVKQNDAKVKK
jgi:uncharacterized protein YdhG (YjbR/CyaY superfamily)